MLTACTDTDDLLALREHAPIPSDALQIMRSKGMTPRSPIMLRIFKEEDVLEIWKQQDTGRYELVKSYEICAHSGDLGPKFKEGDRQAPEGFYYIGRGQMNPRSSYHLSFNLGFPNAYDRSHGRTGSHLMVHGDCSSAGCYAMTDEGVAEIYAFARDALRGGIQQKFQVQAFPFRMTPENMARYAEHRYFDYWTMLKEGYDHFELTRVPPNVDVCEKRYVFNQQSEGRFIASATCPEMEMPEGLRLAYERQQKEHNERFEAELARLNAEEEAKKVEVEQVEAEVPATQSAVEPAQPAVVNAATTANTEAPSPAARPLDPFPAPPAALSIPTPELISVQRP